jgi:hypothetical protein
LRLPRAFSEMPNTEIRTEFYWWKTRATPGISKTIRDCRYYQRFHFLQDTII